MNVPKLRFKEFSEPWQIKRLNEITQYVDYRGKTPEKSDSGMFLVTAKNIRLGYIDYVSSKEYIPIETYEDVMRRGKPLIGDVLITTEAPLGNVACVDREDIALAQRVIKLRGLRALMQNTFLKYRLLSDNFQKLIYEKATGGTVKGIKGSVLHKINIQFPSLPEQTKIANFLTAIDEKISQLTQKHDLLTQYKKGVMQQIFSQKLRFKDDDGRELPGWEERILGEIADVTKLAGYEFTKHIIYRDSGKIIALRGLNVKENKLDLADVKFIDESDFSKLNRSKLIINDLLFTYVGTIGNVALITENDRFYLAPNVSRIRVNTNILLPGFALQYFNDSDFKEEQINLYIATSSQPALSMENIRKFKLNLPSIKEQTKIANFLTAIDDKITHTQNQLQAVKKYKQGLLQQMFV